MRRTTPWLGLGAVLVLFLGYIAWLRPTRYFGVFHDDTIYFSTAQSLAQGGGYILPSLPGRPPQTKYPVFYPWVLSWCWRLGPPFPSNLSWAVGAGALFACGFLFASFALLRRFQGLGEWPALACLALCALHPLFLFMSGAVMSDTLFMALAMAAAVVAEPALERKNATVLLTVAAIFAGLSVLTRTLGVTVVAGIIATGLWRRLYRKAVIFAVVASGVVAVGVILSRAPAVLPQPPTGAQELGWQQTWAYYTSYWQFWKASVPNSDVFFTMVSDNLKDLLTTPATLCLFPSLGGESSYAGVVVSVTLTVAMLIGLWRQIRGDRLRPIHLVLAFYPSITLVWNYALMDRYLMLFLPLFYAGFFIEGRHLARMLAVSLRSPRPLSEKIVAAGFSVGLAAVVGLSVDNYARGLRPNLQQRGAQQAALLPEKMEAYDWIRRSTGPQVRFVAYEDAGLYLHTGRQAMWIMAFSTGAFLARDKTIMQREVAHITDVARHVGARYWLSVDGDFYRERGSRLILDRLAQLRSGLPLVFRSRSGKAEIYDLSCVSQPERGECRQAATVLPPEGL